MTEIEWHFPSCTLTFPPDFACSLWLFRAFTKLSIIFGLEIIFYLVAALVRRKQFVCDSLLFTKMTLGNDPSVVVSELPATVLVLVTFDPRVVDGAEVAHDQMPGTVCGSPAFQPDTVQSHLSEASESSVPKQIQWLPENITVYF